MIAEELPISGLYRLTPRVFHDKRGCFFESWNARDFAAATGVQTPFVQDNQSISRKGTLRGLHFQCLSPQGKLVRVDRGEIFDVAVDLRSGSPTFGKWHATVLSEENRAEVWVPEGFAHGFLVLSEVAVVMYKVTDYWNPQGERTVNFADPSIGIEWPDVGVPLLLSEKDASAPYLAELKLP